ncbi:MAG: hypothetical protein HQK88_01985 [Nitrospirae bacterium]|nr:hypothetical protein [Nitrospirota bacterium]MBF0533724.1 hypothetical protein [Nitrospirota bacterium]MBF0615567.1 hypothetical protein [Nitrospirota bacterium]
MIAELIYHEKKYYKDDAIKEIKIWRVPRTKDKPFGYKYSLVYIVRGERIVGYDNSEGKGDHRHFKEIEYPYKFQTLDKLWADFETDIKNSKEDKS